MSFPILEVESLTGEISLNNSITQNGKHLSTKPNLLAIIIVIELVLGGAGRLLTFGPLTIRYILFLLAILYFIFKIIRNNFIIEKNIFYIPVILFFCFYVISIMNGLLRGYPFSDVILSSQGYLYLLMFFPFSLLINTSEKAKVIIEIFNKASILLALLTIGIFFAFSLQPSLYSVLNPILLNLEYGHLSVRYGLPSVFLKTSPYMAIAFIHELYAYVSLKSNRNTLAVVRMLILVIACLMTMTMGIWLSLVFGVLLVILFSRGSKKITAITLTVIVAVFTFSIFSDFISETIFNRFSRTDKSFIIKFNQLTSLISVWLESFLLGKGFGVRLLFKSEVATREMVKFELFWLELLVNMGLLGFISYIHIIIKNLFVGLKTSKFSSVECAIKVKSLMIGVLMLTVVSSVNPFLNNPIGIGYLIIAISSVSVFNKETVGKQYTNRKTTSLKRDFDGVRGVK